MNNKNGSILEQLITPEDLVTTFGVSLASIYRLTSGRKIPFYKVGGLIRFKKVDIEEYLAEARIEPIKL